MRVSFWLIVILLLIGCSSVANRKDGTMEVTDDILKLMVREEKATVFQNDTLKVNFEKLFEKRVEPFTGFVYLLNSSCSFCVAQFLNFLSFLEKKDINLSVVVIVEDGGSVSAKFYMKQVGFDKFDKIEFTESSKGEIVSENLEYYSGIITYIVENKRIDSVRYEEILSTAKVSEK